MIKEFKEFSTGAIFKIGNKKLLVSSYQESKLVEFYSLIWSRTNTLKLEVDGISLQLPPHHILVLTPNQYFRFESGSPLIIYQFNREFYCIKDHDKEVSCMGILFFGNSNIPIIRLTEKDQQKLNALHEVFLEEMETTDTIQAEMLRMLTARFIITMTRLIKQQTVFEEIPANEQVDLVREFNAMVEFNFRKEHSVTFYAEQLYKSPKTLSNIFSKLKRSPLQVIHDRIVLEAKRLLMYTDKSSKEIAYELGFEEASHLSRIFKKHTSLAPTEFKKRYETKF